MSSNTQNDVGFRWIRNPDQMGERQFTFDGKRIFNLYRDYPHELSPEEKEEFDNANPFWADYFKERSK